MARRISSSVVAAVTVDKRGVQLRMKNSADKSFVSSCKGKGG
jgi:hypothetical protein